MSEGVQPQAGSGLRVLLGALEPAYGMERVARSLLSEIVKREDVEVVVVEGPAWSEGLSRGESLGPRLQGWQRVRAPLRMWALRRRPRTTVVVGIWAALPWLLVAPRRTRTIVWEHSLAAERVAVSSRFRVLARLARLLYGRAETVVCPSEALAEDVRRIARHPRVVVIPNIVGPETLARRRAPERSFPLNLLSVGSLSPLKRQSLLIDALPLLPPDVSLTLVGDGPLRAELEERARRHGVRSRVRFLGYLDAAATRAEMLRADVLVHAAVVETFGMVLFEAAQCGLPVVAHRTRLTEDFIPRLVPGCVFDPRVESLVESLAQVASLEPELVTAAAERRAEELAPSSIIDRWVALWSS